MTNSSARVLDARLLFSIIAAGIMSFSGVVVETAMNVTFPTLMHEFNIGTSLVQWITTGYLLVLALFCNAQLVYCCYQQLSCRHTARRLVALFQCSAYRQIAAGHRYRHCPADDV